MRNRGQITSERLLWMNPEVCIYCHQTGLCLATCPLWPKEEARQWQWGSCWPKSRASPVPLSHMQLDATLVLVQMRKAEESLSTLLTLTATFGRLTPRPGYPQHKTLYLVICGNHHESLSFTWVIHLMLLWFLVPWLKWHNPNFDWVSGRVSSWSSFCLTVFAVCQISCGGSCFHACSWAFRPHCHPGLLSWSGHGFEVSILPLLWPLHHPYDCTIDSNS